MTTQKQIDYSKYNLNPLPTIFGDNIVINVKKNEVFLGDKKLILTEDDDGISIVIDLLEDDYTHKKFIRAYAGRHRTHWYLNGVDQDKLIDVKDFNV